MSTAFKSLCIVFVVFSLVSCNQQQQPNLAELAPTPPMGWNSFDSYGVYLYEEAAFENLEAFAEKLAPHGYEYFVIDAGWFGEYKLQKGSRFSAEKFARDVAINKYGILQPSHVYFPNGFKPLIDRCHELGLKFGLHLMRGIPREAYRENTPIEGTPYFARDIADVADTCHWNNQNYGVNMDAPGAQEFYNSVVNEIASWGVDFIKYDDIIPHPDEVEAVAKAVQQCDRPIVLSLSPGSDIDIANIDFFKKANMVRITHDIWDDQDGIDECFAAWRKWGGLEEPGFWIDMDMIPFGQLQLMSPPHPDPSKTIWEKGDPPLCGEGVQRWCRLSKAQMITFITMRALAASPLMMGGDLPSLDEFSLKLLTNKEMIECNQNGVMGELVYDQNSIEIWQAPEKETQNGWIGIFNRSEKPSTFQLSPEMVGLNADYAINNIWADNVVALPNDFQIEPNGAVFLSYTL